MRARPTMHALAAGRRAPAWRLALLSLTALLGLAAGGCGVSTEQAPSLAPRKHATRPAGPQRPLDRAIVEGGTMEALTPSASASFERRSSNHVSFTDTGTAQAFTDLCSRRADLIEPGRPISRAEKAACARRHVGVVGPFVLGADAVVLVTRNKSDVGGDCLSVSQARDIFRTGSAYTNWSQLGFFDLPLQTTGSLGEPVVNDLFARQVLGQPGALTLADLRTDFAAEPGADRVRHQVIGSERLARARAIARARIARLRAQTSAQRARLVDAAIRRADRQVLARIARTNARNKRLKIRVDGDRLVRDNRRMSHDAKVAAADRANAQFDARLSKRASRLTSGPLSRATAPGWVGFVRFTYYETYEEQLRPFEIDATGAPANPQASLASKRAAGENGGSAPDCVFPSLQTVSSGHFPLARQLLIYTTREALQRRPVADYLLYVVRNAQQLAASGGLVPVTDQQLATDLRLLGVQPAAAPKASTSAPAATPAPAPAASPAGSVPGVGSGGGGAGGYQLRPGAAP